MSTQTKIWLVSDQGNKRTSAAWAYSALIPLGVVRWGNAHDALAWIADGQEVDAVVLDLASHLSGDLVSAAIDAGAALVCLGGEGRLVDMALGRLYMGGVPAVPNAPGHELELLGTLAEQLERVGK